MTASVAGEAPLEAPAFVPRILVFSTHNISDPGIDLAGSSHMHYTPGVMVMPMPCTSGIKPAWIAHAIKRGFDGVFVASDGDECAYLPDCAQRASRIMAEANTLLKGAGQSTQRLKMAAIFSRWVDWPASLRSAFACAMIREARWAQSGR